MIARRLQQVQAPVIPIVGRLTLEHPGTISLGQGVVHYPPPREVIDAVARSVTEDRALNRYASVVGGDLLLQRMAEKLRAENKIDVSDGAASIVCTAGANMGFLNAVLAIADVDDEIILLGPYYFNHQMAIEIAGCRAVVVSTDTDHQPDVARIESAITDRTRAVVTVSPNNPTGAVYPETTLRAINSLCRNRGIYHVCDEAYEYFTFNEQTHFSPGSLPGANRHTISIYSLSKAYGMAGWRVGYSVVPTALLESIKKIQDTNLICPPIVCQRAAEAALNVGSSWCRQQSAGLVAVRDAALEVLSTLGNRCSVSVPGGAFYLFLRLKSDQPEMELVEQLIKQYGVAVLPGEAFGWQDGCSLRLSYGAIDADSAMEGMHRLRQGLSELL